MKFYLIIYTMALANPMIEIKIVVFMLGLLT